VTESTPPASGRGGGPPVRRDVPRAFEWIEHWIAVGIGVLLSVAAVLALTGAVPVTWDATVHWPDIRSLFAIVDRLLFVLMLIEILHTVRTSIQSHRLATEPFLIVGLIATIRRILVVTLETSDQTPAAGQARIGTAPSFEHAMIELGILAILTLVIAIAIYLSHRPRDE